MKRNTSFLPMAFGVFACLLVGCGGGPSEVRCGGTHKANDPQTGWACTEVEQGGLWACTCSGPGQVDQSVSDEICEAAKACQ